MDIFFQEEDWAEYLGKEIEQVALGAQSKQ